MTKWSDFSKVFSDKVVFDNSESTLQSDDVETVIVELDDKVNGLDQALTAISGTVEEIESSDGSNVTKVVNQDQFNNLFELFDARSECAQYGVYKVKSEFTDILIAPGSYSVESFLTSKGNSSNYCCFILHDNVKTFMCDMQDKNSKVEIDFYSKRPLGNLGALAIRQYGAHVRGIKLTRYETQNVVEIGSSGFQLLGDAIQLEDCEVENFYRSGGSGENVYSFTGALTIDNPDQSGGYYSGEPIWSPWTYGTDNGNIDTALCKLIRCSVLNYNKGFYQVGNLVDCVAKEGWGITISPSALCSSVNNIDGLHLTSYTHSLDTPLFNYCSNVSNVTVTFRTNYATWKGVFSRCNNISNILLDEYHSEQIHLMRDILKNCNYVRGFKINLGDGGTFSGDSVPSISNCSYLQELDFTFGKVHDDANENVALFYDCSNISEFKFNFTHAAARTRMFIFDESKFISSGIISSSDHDRMLTCFHNSSYISLIQLNLQEEHYVAVGSNYLSDIKATMLSSSTIQNTNSFFTCKNLTNCSVQFPASSTLTTGFRGCIMLSTCSVNEAVYGFHGCENIVACRVDNCTAGFTNCKYLAACSDLDNTSSSGNISVDSDSCSGIS